MKGMVKVTEMVVTQKIFNYEDDRWQVTDYADIDKWSSSDFSWMEVNV